MANKVGPAPHLLGLENALARAPHRFGFFEVMRRLERLHRDLPKFGASARPADDPIRLAQQPALAFAPSTLAAFKANDGKPPRLEVLFLGLFGPNGPLPTHLNEYAYERMRHANDPTFARFADIFHHRMLSLFYRAWAISQPAADYDRPQSSAYTEYIGALIGIGRPAFKNRDAVADSTKLHYAGRLACQARNAEGLEAMLAGYLRLAVAIEEFVGEWIGVPERGLCRLGQSPEVSGLGLSVIVGTRIWSGQQKFRIRLGPMSYEDYQRFLPLGRSLQRLVAAVRNYLGDELNWNVMLVLKRDEVPALRLGECVRLGWTTWLGKRAAATDAADLHLNPLAFSPSRSQRNQESAHLQQGTTVLPMATAVTQI